MTMSDLSVYERVAVLEVQMRDVATDVKEIKGKLDELLTLKSKGVGAFWLVGLILSSGVLGLIAAFTDVFKHGH